MTESSKLMLNFTTEHQFLVDLSKHLVKPGLYFMSKPTGRPCIIFFRLNFSDAEIEIFCAKYDRDGDFTFDLDEINAIENGLEMEMDGEQVEEPVEIPYIPGADQIDNEPPPPPPNQGMLNG